MTLQMYFATAMWLLMILGYRCRKVRKLHIPLVLTAIFGDISLVLYLELTRGAVETAISFSLDVWQQIHILFSSIALICYFPLLIVGIQLMKGNEQVRRIHRRLALLTLLFRTLGFIFMFSMWKSIT